MSTEIWRGAIIVVFRQGTTAERIRELVTAQTCRLQVGFDGSSTVNVVVVKPGDDEAMVANFEALPEVENAWLNDQIISLP